ncbi:MAG: hypothetical protein VX777_00885 [Chlamydiota bacterium]|nr:hypothetical protein [Chlamydiota bacterium]
MSISNVDSIKGANGFQCEKSEQDWKTLTRYDAPSNQQEKICRVANNLILGVALYGAYSYYTGPIGLVSYAGMALAARKLASTTIGYLVYPAALTSVHYLCDDYLQKLGNRRLDALKQEGYVANKISIYKSGTRYDAALIGHSSTINNGKWTIEALGNGMAMEFIIDDLPKENFKNQSNTLLINGPSVGASGGWPTRYQLGAGFEAGIDLLEREVKATHIIMRGLSLGGGMMAEAILNHDFTEGKKREVRYLSISDRTFSKLSTIAGNLVGRVVEPVFYLTGTELDGVGAAKKLSDLNIRHIVIQHNSHNAQGSDYVIPDSASLAHKLHQEGDLKNKVFLESDRITHNSSLPLNIERDLAQEISRFFQT